jgi:hypothetical protein
VKDLGATSNKLMQIENLLYLCPMFSEAELKQRWQQLESALAVKAGRKPTLAEILLFIGIREAGISLKSFTENEREDLIQLAVCTILTQAKYYELIWVDATGWPHFKQLKPLPFKNLAEGEEFLKKYLLLFDGSNNLVKQPFYLI